MFGWISLVLLSVISVSLNTHGLDLQPTTDDEEDCFCVKYFQCNNNGTINTSGAGIVNVRQKTKVCADITEFCCTLEDISKSEKVSTKLPQLVSSTTTAQPTSTNVLQPKTSTLSPPLSSSAVTTLIESVSTAPRVEFFRNCGLRNAAGIGVRFKGNETKFGEFPWMVAILNGATYKCGGALIHPQVIITAAHCVSEKDAKYTVRAGEWNTQHDQEQFAHQDKEVRSVTIHPEYYADALFNDIAFLVLDIPVEPAENVGFICLPSQESQFDTGRCISTGWGKDIFGTKGKHPTILKKVDLPLVPRDVCQEQLRKTRLGKFFQLHKSFMCAGGELDKDVCTGDGGSPLVCPIKGDKERYYQAGIVAWGIGCGDVDVPGVYADVSLFRNWIDDQMLLNKFNTTIYTY